MWGIAFRWERSTFDPVTGTFFLTKHGFVSTLNSLKRNSSEAIGDWQSITQESHRKHMGITTGQRDQNHTGITTGRRDHWSWGVETRGRDRTGSIQETNRNQGIGQDSHRNQKGIIGISQGHTGIKQDSGTESHRNHTGITGISQESEESNRTAERNHT